MRFRPSAILAVATFGLATGCTAERDDDSSMRQRQDAALKDPFSYGPTVGQGTGAPNRPIQEPEMKKHDDSFKGEWDRFWNP